MCKLNSLRTSSSGRELCEETVHENHQHYRIKRSLSSLIKLSHLTFIFILVNVITQETNGQQTGRKSLTYLMNIQL